MPDKTAMQLDVLPISYLDCGALGGIRTPDPRFRRPMLYPLSYERGRDRVRVWSQSITAVSGSPIARRAARS